MSSSDQSLGAGHPETGADLGGEAPCVGGSRGSPASIPQDIWYQIAVFGAAQLCCSVFFFFLPTAFFFQTSPNTSRNSTFSSSLHRRSWEVTYLSPRSPAMCIISTFRIQTLVSISLSFPLPLPLSPPFTGIMPYSQNPPPFSTGIIQLNLPWRIKFF